MFVKRGLWLALCSALAGPAWSLDLNALKEVRLSQKGAEAEVVVVGSRPPQFTVFRLNEPDRLVVDFSSADASSIEGQREGQGPISGIVVSQFSDDHSSVGRLLVALRPDAQYEVHPEGNQLVVSVKPGVPDAPKAKDRPSVIAAASSDSLPASGAQGAEADPPRIEHPAKKIVGLRLSQHGLFVRTDGDVAKYEVLELDHPPRLALDVFGLQLHARVPRSTGPVKAVRAASHDGKVRLVLDFEGPVAPHYRVERSRHGLTLALEDAPVPANAEAEIDGKKIPLAETSPLPIQPPASTIEPKPENAQTAEVVDVEFKEKPEGGRVDIKLSKRVEWKVEHPDDKSAVLTLEKARLPKHLERSLDTSALDTPVKVVSAFAVPGQDRVRVVVSAANAFEDVVKPGDSGLHWQFAAKGDKTEQVASRAIAAPATAEPEAPAESESRYVPAVAKNVSFEFKDIDIHNLLRVIAEVSRKNIVVADDVSGKVTIRLRNVPWQQALDLILRSKGLGKEEMGNIIRVAPLKQLQEEANARAERKKAMMAQEDLAVQLVPVNYAAAKDLVDRVKEVLSPRGNVAVDQRTNVLIVRDVQSNIGRARALVKSLDLQTPQVLIESRIVEANTNFNRQIGVQWGGLAQAAPGTGNATGLVFPNTVSVQGGSTPDANAGTANDPHFAVNLPAAVGTSSGGALGFTFGSIGGALALNLRLSALETQGQVKTISAPKVTTLDNITAKISQGLSIPYSVVSAQGVNTIFVEARLELQVTPHITQDGSVLMSIHAQNAQPDPSLTGANGQPAIQRKEAVTQVMVKDGDTTVIGGIYIRRGASNENRVPFFSQIPVLGWLFHDHTESDDRQELLIFITPRIINRQVIAQTL